MGALGGSAVCDCHHADATGISLGPQLPAGGQEGGMENSAPGPTAAPSEQARLGADVTLPRLSVTHPQRGPSGGDLGVDRSTQHPWVPCSRSRCGIVGAMPPSHLEQKAWVRTGGVGPWFPW